MLLRPFLILLALLLPCTTLADDRAIKRKPAATEGRTALVIGNAAYDDAPLANPVHDAEDMAAALKKSGFKVDLQLNSSQRQMERAIQKLGNRLRNGGVGLFYFAGHGIQVNGVNYLVPVDANITTEADVRFEAVDANRALAQMQEAGNRLNMVFLDACRNNPYKRSFRSASNGLAAMDAPRGTLVSFATAPGNVAADGTGRNGIYTKHLLRQMAKKDLEIGRMMRQVRRGVQEDTKERQTPFELSSLTGDFYFYKGTATNAAATVSTTVSGTVIDGDTDAEDMWLAVRDTSNPAELRLFLTEYPNNSHRGLAKLRLARLEEKKRESQQQLEPEPGRLYVTATPGDALIRILNIKPRYSRGMQLAAGKYHIEVAKPGYTSNWQWITVADREELKVAVSLDKISLVKPVTVTVPSIQSSGASEVKPDGRFIANSNGTVKDSKTGLTWAAKDNGYNIGWKGAKRYCQNYRGGGYTDWRMPTQDELHGLYGTGSGYVAKCTPKYKVNLTSLIKLTCFAPWASETRGSEAAYVLFSDGRREWEQQSNSSYGRALPVRGGS